MIDFILSKNYRLSNDQITETYDSILQEGVAGPDQYHQEIYRTAEIISLIGCANAAYIPHLKEGVLRGFG